MQLLHNVLLYVTTGVDYSKLYIYQRTDRLNTGVECSGGRKELALVSQVNGVFGRATCYCTKCVLLFANEWRFFLHCGMRLNQRCLALGGISLVTSASDFALNGTLSGFVAPNTRRVSK